MYNWLVKTETHILLLLVYSIKVPLQTKQPHAYIYHRCMYGDGRLTNQPMDTAAGQLGGRGRRVYGEGG